MMLDDIIMGRGFGENATATPATFATVQGKKPDAVAKVAGVAVATQQKPVSAFSPQKVNVEAWRDRLWGQLDEKPTLNYAIEVALPADDSPGVEICVARRGVGTFILNVPRGTMTPLECQLRIFEFCNSIPLSGDH
jgi:hypothetical protein